VKVRQRGRRSLEILPVELQRNVDELRGTCAGWRCYRVNGWKGSLKYNIQHHSRNRTMYEWSGRPCLGSLPFRRRHPVSLPEHNQTPVFFPLRQLRLKQADGVGHAICLDDWLVVLCRLDLSDGKKILKSYSMRYILLLIS
jgi:hypothetical protein